MTSGPLTLGGLSAAIERRGEGFVLHGASGWLQGRTMYGGASSYLAYAAARTAFPDLPPLRGAQVGFVAPVGEDVEISARILRAGKSVSQIETEITANGELAHRALWLFGSGRPSNGTVAANRLDIAVPYDQAAPVKPHPDPSFFIHRMELRHAFPRGENPPGTIRRWVRLKDRSGLDPIGELIGIGDTLPPGAMRTMERMGPISSINWSLTLLGDKPETDDGWWLLETSSNHAADGFSSETLRMWNTDGVEVMRGLQSVAIFG
ncbi:thioesterase family protein [Novosphingobium sp. KCTC 2891]|uniref:thioesterase family protein n=1 Tax=Novosphingobium sp. KCTC 2891 TaxID=2989730 RepID=UPI0022232199|nr:thioesterase family protein [Novosphingobium sp. KCTC 2891]MCW1383890.1 thioesterase family protein [Novosphingobium sp. KCTC 2891]